ncbi:hypothetical protein [Marinobacterium jannaschii]|uniref:hypothetical protein n=1 Tax=Marinobacterium jannaschii TaxID=64970 RepID=UPI000485884A|nr:hypothetical protein [Marinobacterium jannaschii]
MGRKKKIEPSTHVGHYVVEGVGLTELRGAIKWAEKKDYSSGHTFTYKGKKVRAWLAGHYLRYFK